MSQKRIAASALALLAALCLCGAGRAASWNAFTIADLTGVEVAPDPADGVLSYYLSLAPGATIGLDGGTHDIAWLGGFYLRTDSETDSFTAEDAGAVADWDWTERQGNLVGWHSQGRDRIYAGGTKAFAFASLTIPAGVTVSPGFHLGYWDGGQVVTAFYASRVVPEPSALAGLTILGTLTGIAMRAARRSKRAV